MGLEYLVIPTGWEDPRIKRAKKELDKDYIDNVVITGYVNREKLVGSNRQKIYKAIREHGVKPSKMRILDGIDSEEDVLYLGRILNQKDTLYFDTFPLHYLEYKTLINKAIRDGKFPKGVNVKIASIGQGKMELVYGILGLLEEVFKRRRLDYKKNRREDNWDKIKQKIRRLMLGNKY